jgi:hypothetical protein
VTAVAVAGSVTAVAVAGSVTAVAVAGSLTAVAGSMTTVAVAGSLTAVVAPQALNTHKLTNTTKRQTRNIRIELPSFTKKSATVIAR